VAACSVCDLPRACECADAAAPRGRATISGATPVGQKGREQIASRALGSIGGARRTEPWTELTESV